MKIIKSIVLFDNNKYIGAYTSDSIPEIGDILDFKNARYLVRTVAYITKKDMGLTEDSYVEIVCKKQRRKLE
jgi:hypothetical protein